MTKQERVEMYRSFLADEGFTPRVDDDGDLFFKYEGRNYIILVSEKDESYFNLVFPGFWSIDNETERRKAAEAAQHATSETKVAKVFPVGDNTWASIEMFCSPPEAFKPVFQRCLRALRTAVNTFGNKMRE